MAKQMLCPKYCGTTMQQIKVAGITLDQCPACEGLWFDSRGDEMYATLRLGREDIPEQLKRSWSKDRQVPKDRPKEYNCPRCGRVMESRWFGTKDMEGLTFLIDSCPEDCGTWLDDGELAIARGLVAKLAPDVLTTVRKQGGFLQVLASLFER